MIETIFKAVVGITVIAGGWLTVQIAWQRVFAGAFTAPDARANGVGCHGCGRASCETRALNKTLIPTPQINRED